jgi:polyisoprenoid-binding protein YceI
MITNIRFQMATQLVLLTAAIFLARVAMGAPVRDYEVVSQPGARTPTGVSFQIAYTFGVHNGSSGAITGHARAAIDPLELTAARFSVPIATMTTGSALRDCHMRESLGLDYSRSRFPEDHVCSLANELPAAGPDAIAFPTIDVSFIRVSSARSAPSAAELAVRAGQAADFDVEADLSVHGVTRRVEIPVRVELEGGGKLRVKSTFEIKLADHGIVVKAFSGVNVRDRARVALDLLLAPLGGAR